MDKAMERHLLPFNFLCCHCTVTVALHKETSNKHAFFVVAVLFEVSLCKATVTVQRHVEAT